MFNIFKKLKSLEEKIERLESLLLVEDYFTCEKCGKEKISKATAKSFNAINGWGAAVVLYTTPYNFELHSKEIAEAETYWKSMKGLQKKDKR